jgi:pimeloyl-ACP methyl ester carboxylesterase
VDTRLSTVPGLKLPTWQEVMGRSYDDWSVSRLVVDTFSRGETSVSMSMLAQISPTPARAFIILPPQATNSHRRGSFDSHRAHSPHLDGRGELVSPERRPVQDYHREWLNHSAPHGLSIKAFSTSQRTPCLLAEPDAEAGPAERGQRLREQLQALGHSLEPYGTVQATLVLLHGRKGRKEDLLPVAERFCAAGFRCIMPDLPAHGENPTATVCFATVDEEARLPETVLAEAAQKFHFSPGPAGLWGMSMGGAFAVRAASSSPDHWGALVVVSSFDTLGSVIDGQLQWSRGGTGLIRIAGRGGGGGKRRGTARQSAARGVGVESDDARAGRARRR